MNLENRFFYRLVKVLRIASIAFFLMAIPIWVFWNTSASDSLRHYPGSVITDPYILAQLNATPPTKQELLALAAQDNRAEHLIFLEGIVFFILFYPLINLFSETLLYLAYGKTLSWGWIKFFNTRQKQK